LAALNFYGTNFANTGGTYHIDDVSVTELPPPLTIASDKMNTLALFPNPAQNFFVVGGLDATKSVMTITDLSGKVFMNNSLNAANNVVDVSVLDAGIYLVTIEKENSRTVKKLVVQ
jgi:hypothetical protein